MKATAQHLSISGSEGTMEISQLRSGWLISHCRFATQMALSAMTLFLALGAVAQTTNNLSNAEIHGQRLAQQLCDQKPETNLVQTGILQIRGLRYVELPIEFQAHVNPDGWYGIYQTTSESNRVKLIVAHALDKPNHYVLFTNLPPLNQQFDQIAAALPNSELVEPFANSDFWLCDLGLEFFHWPDQKILRGETMRGVFCKVLESTNPHPPTNGYSRVVSWIDNESLGIVQAKAYDAKGKLLKEFYPKDIKKVAGQWQVGSMEIDNVQTRSRTFLKFDLKPN